MALTATAQTAPAPRWEAVNVTVEVAVDDVEVAVRDGYIYVSLARPAQVKIFTILGQPVTQATLPAGTSRIKVPARGIYILKTGSATKRITI